MSLSLDIFQTGYGVSDSGQGTYRWHGHSFNPTSNPGDGSQSWDIWSYPDIVGAFSVYIPTNSFGLSGFQYGIEVVMGVVKFSNIGEEDDSGYLYLRFYDPNDNLVLSYSWSWYLPPPFYRYYWIGMGIKTNVQEIWKNGTYRFYCKITNNGGASTFYEGNYNFTISDYPSITHAGTSNRGYLWVEGDNLTFVCYQNGVKIVIPNDATATYVGTEYNGHIWLEADGKISFVANGYKRRTKLGDRYGYGGVSSEIPGSPGAGHAGHIWVCFDFNDTYLIIISPNGVKYRIGAGSIIGDYQ